MSLESLADREGDIPPKVDAPSNNNKPSMIDYTPPKHLYSFPPNSASLYPPPGDTRKPISVSSYLPPPSGPTNYPIYPGPLMPTPHSSSNTQIENSGSVDSMNGNDDVNGNDDSNVKSNNLDGSTDDMNPIDKPSPDFPPNRDPEYPPPSFLNHDHQHDHDHSPDFDHHHHHHHHDDHIHDAPFYDDSLKHLHGFEAFPGENRTKLFH